ncbi:MULTISPECIES: flagellar basal body P-ring formation chaperone FlgA [Comamonas]|jgi:flagella basal body P-ring formation protein FlgA|uniref:flagellar basal body P-ring formation chaperone FlgA n=1 Tax=Comamonas TaxID=283 RepID=UPI00257B63CD|nr:MULTISPECIES: flagellar basal body P-ring formation chaperone FlgA [Comamonas]
MVDSVFPLSLTASRMARAVVRAGVGLLVAVSASTVWAEDLADISNQWLQGALAQTEAQQSMPLRMEVQVGKLDPRLNLAPCLRVEPYLPSGSKLWGRTRIGMRCVEGAKPWNVFMPVTIRAFGPAWVLVNNVSMGEVLTHEHAMQSEVDWAESPHSIIALPDDWVGQTAARNLTAGMALRQTMVKAPEIFKPGAGVKVVVQGSGFAVTSSGKALESGSAGQNVRVRMENGRTVIGTVNQQGEVVVAQ